MFQTSSPGGNGSRVLSYGSRRWVLCYGCRVLGAGTSCMVLYQGDNSKVLCFGSSIWAADTTCPPPNLGHAG